MNASTESKFKMLLALRILLRTNPSILATLPNSTGFLMALDTAILLIQTNSELLQYNIKGVSGSKKHLRAALEHSTLSASTRVQANAMYTNNRKLLAETRLTSSYLKRISDIELVNVSKAMLSLIDANMPALAGYGLTEASQAAYGKEIQAYETAIPDARQKQVTNKESNRLVLQGMDEANEALANLDALVEIVRYSDPDFYSSYKTTRKVNTSMGSLAAKGTITDATTGLPVVNATIAFTQADNEEVIVIKHSSVKGGFNLKTLDEGVYEVIVSKVGYQPKTVSLTVVAGELCQMNVRLVRN